MRLVGLEVEGFRGWVRRERIDLDAGVIIVEGVNGTGKTSLCDAILWALTGEIPRLGDEHKDEIVSLYSDAGLARVRLELRSSAGAPIVVTRSTDGSSKRLQVKIGATEAVDDAATLALLKELWPSGVGSTEAGGLASALSRAVYLQQDEVRRFLEADTDAERFEAVAELVGASRYTTLQQQLESQRAAWSRQTTERREELRKSQAQLTALETQIESLASSEDSSEGWAAWRGQVVSILGEEALPQDPGSAKAGEAVDAAIRRLDEVVRAHRRTMDQASQAQAELRVALAAPSPEAPAIEEAQARRSQSEAEVIRAQSELAAAEQAAGAERDQLRRLNDQLRELQSLAALALRHLGDRCPVCDQSIDLEKTRERLTALVGRSRDEQPGMAAQQLVEVSARLREAESLQSKAVAYQRELARQSTVRHQALTAATLALKDLGITEPYTTADESLAAVLSRESESIGSLQRLRAEGEGLALLLAGAAERRRRTELEVTCATSREAVAQRSKDVATRERTSELASKIIDGLREASGDLVARKAMEIGPALDRIYSRVDPHPGFKNVQLISRVWYGKGRLETEIRDVSSGLRTSTPHVVLSSSQLNALALSVFLALNLGVPHPPLDAVMLDDPIQSLDDVNLLGVMDLLRRYKANRQLLVSTHDQRFASLLQRKLRPSTSQESMVLVRLVDWTRSGPVLQQATIRTDESPWRIVRRAAQ
jgi:DNA repair exonuclease SbcCD ATPase subunit